MPCVYLGDNKPALCWSSSVDISDIYVFRRVTTLRNVCPKAELRYIRSAENPADILTKPIDTEAFLVCELWWKGPIWLLHKSLWPVEDKKYQLHPVNEVEMHMAQITESKKNERVVPVTLSVFFSEGRYMDNLRAFAYALRWRDRFLGNKVNVKKVSISAEEFSYAKVEAVKIMQKEYFGQELKCKLPLLFAR